MSKTLKQLLNILTLVITAGFISNYCILTWWWFAVYGSLMVVSIIIRNKLSLLTLFSQLVMMFIFMLQLSSKIGFNANIVIGSTMLLSIQISLGALALIVFIYNIVKISKEW